MTYYLTIENNEIIGKSQSLSGGNAFDIEVSEELYNDYEYGKYIYLDNEVVINPEWQNQKQKQLILEQIDELDKKRIRAVCEPSEKEPGLTWLEYYNNEINALRQRLNDL